MSLNELVGTCETEFEEKAIFSLVPHMGVVIWYKGCINHNTYFLLAYHKCDLEVYGYILVYAIIVCFSCYWCTTTWLHTLAKKLWKPWWPGSACDLLSQQRRQNWGHRIDPNMLFWACQSQSDTVAVIREVRSEAKNGLILLRNPACWLKPLCLCRNQVVTGGSLPNIYYIIQPQLQLAVGKMRCVLPLRLLHPWPRYISHLCLERGPSFHFMGLNLHPASCSDVGYETC